MPTPPNPAPKGRKTIAQDKVQDASPDEVLGNPRKKTQAPQGAKQIKPTYLTAYAVPYVVH